VKCRFHTAAVRLDGKLYGMMACSLRLRRSFALPDGHQIYNFLSVAVSASRSGGIVSTVSSPMLERRKVLPLIFP
jgi:hypothetical protein